MCGLYVTLWHPAVAPVPTIVPVVSVVVKNTVDKENELTTVILLSQLYVTS